MKTVGWGLVVILGIAAVLTLDPAIVGLSELTPITQAISMRGLLAAGAFALGLLLVLIAVLARKTAGRARRTLVIGVIALLVGAGHAGVLLERGVGAGEAFAAPPEGAIDVLTLNTLGARGELTGLVELIDEVSPHVVALQETPADDVERVAQQVSGEYQVFTAATGPDPVQATALLVSVDLGEYEQTAAPATRFGGVWARPVDGVGPDLLSVHPVPPVPSNVPTWRAELDAIMALCERVEGVVLAGDFNATVDHAGLRDAACVDGSVNTGGHATWPDSASPLLGTTIDHVLMDPQVWEPVASRVFDAPTGGDHRAVLVRIVPVA